MIILLSKPNTYTKFTIFGWCVMLSWHTQNIHPVRETVNLRTEGKPCTNTKAGWDVSARDAI